MDIPAAKKKRALEAIGKAMSETVPEKMENPNSNRTANWKFMVKLRLGGHIKRKVAVWGGDYYPLIAYDPYTQKTFVRPFP